MGFSGKEEVFAARHNSHNSACSKMWRAMMQARGFLGTRVCMIIGDGQCTVFDTLGTGSIASYDLPILHKGR